GAPVSYGPVERCRWRRVLRSVTWISIRSMRMSVAAEVALLQRLLPVAAFAVRADAGLGIRSVLPLLLEVLPRRDAALLEVGHEIPQRRPQHMVGEAGEPGDVHAQLPVLVEREIARQLALHERERPFDRRTRLPDLVHRMRRLELHPVDAALLLVS